MNNDLISRSELKKALHNFFDGKVIDEPAYILRDVFCYIDGAPTVDTTEQEENAYNEGYAHGLETKRPPDKWGKWVISEIQCPICFEYFQTDCYSMEELKKCPSCGADLRGWTNDS